MNIQIGVFRKGVAAKQIDRSVHHKIRQAKWRRQARTLLYTVLAVIMALLVNLPTLVIAQTVSTNSIAAPATELRGVWLTNVDSEILFSRDNLERGIERLKRLNFNTIYPTVWNGGHTLYPSEVAEKWVGEAVDPTPAFEDRDMLAETIEIAHDQGLSVIPWFEFGLMAPEGSELAERHPDWLMSRKDGSQVQIAHGDHRFVWFNPAHPEVQEMLKDLVIEVVSKYDIDGIQFDDHFGTPVEFGYDDYTVQLYQEDHNGRRPPNNPEDREWMRWRASQVSTMMVKIFAAVKTRKPDCLISLSPNPKEFSYRRFLQDWSSWVRLGFIDEVIIQVYRTDRNHFIGELDKENLRPIRAQVPVSIGILTGLRVLNVDIEQIREQVQLTRDRKFAGFSFFFYESLGDRDEAFEALLPEPASRPDVRNYAAGA